MENLPQSFPSKVILNFSLERASLAYQKKVPYYSGKDVFTAVVAQSLTSIIPVLTNTHTVFVVIKNTSGSVLRHHV